MQIPAGQDVDVDWAQARAAKAQARKQQDEDKITTREAEPPARVKSKKEIELRGKLLSNLEEYAARCMQNKYFQKRYREEVGRTRLERSEKIRVDQMCVLI